MALELAVRDRSQSKDILDRQTARITNSDRQARFAFVKLALSAQQSERDAFFESLKRDENRSHEPWVIEALRYLHHPVVASRSTAYLRPGLDLLEEIQRTGDIFFPQRWLSALFDGHRSPEAAAIVQAFLDEHPAYPYRLKNKILQSADELFRAAKSVEP
jgi:aminopeptidase N